VSGQVPKTCKTDMFLAHHFFVDPGTTFPFENVVLIIFYNSYLIPKIRKKLMFTMM